MADVPVQSRHSAQFSSTFGILPSDPKTQGSFTYKRLIHSIADTVEKHLCYFVIFRGQSRGRSGRVEKPKG